jgi:hypothetical protein
MMVQTWLAEDVSANGDSFETIRCSACSNVHIVSSGGKVLSGDGEQSGGDSED